MRLQTRDRVTVRDRMNFYAPGELGKTRSVTPEGYLLCEGVAIARTGTQTYAAHELPLEPNKDGHIIVERLDADVFSEATMASFEGKDVTVEHPNEFVTPDTWQQHSVGHAQNVRRGSGIEDDLLLADILIKSPDAIAYVNRALPEVSCGYNSDYEQPEAGKAIQKNIIGNHIALVDRGRAGPRCAIKDNSPEVPSMSKKVTLLERVASIFTAVQNKDENALKVALATRDDEMDDPTESMDARMKDMEKYIKDRRAKDEAEEKCKTEAEEKATKDAEEEKKKKEMEDAKAKDAVLSAEMLPKLVDLGKVYTGDAAPSELREIFGRAEILSPGIQLPTRDGLKAGLAVPALIATALNTAYTTDQGKACIDPFLMGRTLSALTGDALLGVFNGAAELARVRNNKSPTAISGVRTGDFGRPASIADMNAANREYWAKKDAR